MKRAVNKTNIENIQFRINTLQYPGLPKEAGGFWWKPVKTTIHIGHRHIGI